ncbi:transcription initiation factor-like protein subunit [Phyllosticta capitalensis]|uniref:Transcription initiation factor-like protein subunit n=1 Tax=Phyllosticta capitalensis TaxID=121624 RepID=A0ABR1YL53_9PEZI
MPDVKRSIKVITRQQATDKPQVMEGFPMREWSVEIWLVNENGEEVPANCFEKVVYRLHQSFEKRATQVFKKPPFRITEEGWGEFEMQITLTPVGKGIDHTVDHDLNFAKEVYDSRHVITFKNPKPDLLAVLRESGPVGEENGAGGRSRGSLPGGGKKRKEKSVDMEKLADGLQKLGEDDLLQVVQMVHDNKANDTYTKNDVEAGEFHVDLYTLPDNLVKMLWDFTSGRVEM